MIGVRKFGTAVILCGGKSSRMGFDKGKIKIGQKLLVEVIGEMLEEVFDDIILISKDKNEYCGIKYKIFEDEIENLGPIGGIYTSLKAASSQFVFITACDMPIIDIRFIKFMMEIINRDAVEGVVSMRGGFVEPLYAFYSLDMLNSFEEYISMGSYKLLNILRNCNIHYISEEKISELKLKRDVFTNLNYKKDLRILDEIYPGEKWTRNGEK